jgi:hypothetical protein
MDAHLLIGPVIWGAHRQVIDIFALPERRLRVALPLRGQHDILSRPVMVIRHEEALAKYCGLQRVESGLIDLPGQAVLPLAPRVVGNLEDVLEVVPGLQSRYPLLHPGRTAGTTAGLGEGLLPLLEGL